MLKSKSIFFSIVLFLLSSMGFGQNQTSTFGKEFWVGFMENSSTPLALNLYFATENPANVRVTIPIYGNVNFSLGAKRDTIISIPQALVYVTGSESVNKKGVFISSDTALNVIALNNSPFSSDAISLIPLEYIPKGGRYIVNTFRGSNSFFSEFMVVATEDNTSVEIIPSANTRLGKPAGVPFNVMLQKGEVYQVQSRDSSTMAGSKIRVENGCKKLVVYSGSRCSQVDYNTGCSGCDHLWIQEVPITFWGTDFYSVPVRNMNNGFVLSFVAKEDNTQVKINGTVDFTLNSGQNITRNYFTNDIKCIESDKPISVVQLIKSGECNGHPATISDPSMFRLTPTGQEVKKTMFRVPLTTNISSAYVSVVCDNPSEVFLDGNPINNVSGNVVESSCGTKKIVSFPVIAEYYELSSDEGFNAFLYAFGKDESYTLEIGTAYENLEFNFTLIPEDFIYCNTEQKFDFTAINKGYTNLKWDFDDNNFASGSQSSHKYNNSGRYEVRLIGTKADSDCPEDTIRKFITLYDPPFLDLRGDTVICQEPEYLIVPKTDPNYEFEWQNGSHAKNFLASHDQLVKLTVTDENGCSTTDSAFIVFDDCLEKKIEFPNVFTPGSDGYNDVFEVTVDVFTNALCVIYNRWGQELYKYNPKADKAWNGSVQNDLNSPCPDGTYYFILYFTDPDTNENHTTNGVITLIREKRP